MQYRSLCNTAFALLGIAVLAACAPLNSGPTRDASACPRGAPPTYTVTPVLPEPKIDSSMTLDQIAERSKVDYRYMTLGATESKLIVIGVFNTRIASSSAGGVCAYPTEAMITVGFSDRVIHIAHEFQGSEPCVYKEVLGHEEEHVALDNRILADASASWARTLPQQLTDIDGVWGPDDATARQNLQTRMKAHEDALRAELQEKRNESHARDIDTQEERFRLRHTCNGRLAQLYPEFR